MNAQYANVMSDLQDLICDESATKQQLFAALALLEHVTVIGNDELECDSFCAQFHYNPRFSSLSTEVRARYEKTMTRLEALLKTPSARNDDLLRPLVASLYAQWTLPSDRKALLQRCADKIVQLDILCALADSEDETKVPTHTLLGALSIDEIYAAAQAPCERRRLLAATSIASHLDVLFAANAQQAIRYVVGCFVRRIH